MKIVQLAALSLAAAVLLSGCSGFWTPPPATTTITTTATTLSSGIFYVLDQTTNQLWGYSITSGKLGTVSGSPYTLLAKPLCIAVAPSGGFLYVGTVNGIYLFSIGSGGVLTEANADSPISSDIPAAIEVSGSWLIDAFTTASGSVQMDAIAINASTGVYDGPGGTPPYQAFNVPSASVEKMAFSPDGYNLFVALGTGGTIVVPFSYASSNPLNGTARVIPVQTSGGSALSVAVDPSERVFYIGETLAASGSGGIRAFNYASLTGTLTQATGSPIASSGIAPNAILPEASGDYVYVANGEGDTSKGNIAAFSIAASGTTYTVAALGTIGSGYQPIGVAEDSENNFILAVSDGGSESAGNPDLEAFTMSSGALTAAITSISGTGDPEGAIAIAALP